MIKTVIKRDGSKEAFKPSKLNGWGEWASQTLGDAVDWPSVVLETVSGLPSECSSEFLQEQLIKTCLYYNTWAYNRMAGRLYASMTHKNVYPEGIPTVQQQHRRLAAKGFMVALDYSDKEYEQVETIIDHDRDFTYAHYQVHIHQNKYVIKDRVNNVSHETSQFMYMRMAMALAEKQPHERRMYDIERLYYYLSTNKINAPTPNHVNLGTPLRGYASCLLYTAGDTAKSIGVGNQIAYTMTYMSAGIGSHMNIRSLNNPVRGGVFPHQGKLPYYRALVGNVKSSLQNSRGGACTSYFPIYDPEIDILLRLKNPMSTEDKKIRGMDYSWGFNKFFARKVARNEDMFVFNSYTAPDLYKALYSDDEQLFEELYNRYEADDNFKKTYVSARETFLTANNEWNETGRIYEHNLFEMNHHTPFNDTIHSSNLCVAPDTEILTDKGNQVISTLAGQKVNVWNGEEFSEVEIKKTGENQQLVTVHTDQLLSLDCTLYHKWYIQNDNGDVKEVRTHELKPGDRLADYTLPNNDEWNGVNIHSISNLNRFDDTYCFNEPKRHRGVFNGLLTGQCAEIALPTSHYKDMTDIYSTVDISRVRVKDHTGIIHEIPYDEQVHAVRDTIPAHQLRQGDAVLHSKRVVNSYSADASTYIDYEVVEVLEPYSPEAATCNLAGICVDHIDSEQEYAEAAYYSLLMIDKTIHLAHYELPHIGVTSKKRMNAGVGIIGLAHHMAANGKHYTNLEGKHFIHEVAEKHYWHLLNASLQLGKELGNAPWINRTKWPEGYLPIDTYNRNVDKIADFNNKYDWESLRQQIIDNGGIRNSVIVAHMPSETSSVSSGTTNGLYPVRDLGVGKTDNNRYTYWNAPDDEVLKDMYDIAWDMPMKDVTDMYAIVQKWTDQGISADFYRRVIGDTTIGSTDMIANFLYRVKMGLKTKYYMNQKTSDGVKKDDAGSIADMGSDMDDADCEGCRM